MEWNKKNYVMDCEQILNDFCFNAELSDDINNWHAHLNHIFQTSPNIPYEHRRYLSKIAESKVISRMDAYHQRKISKKGKAKLKKPSKKAVQAYQLRVALGWSQEHCAEVMTKEHTPKKPFKQYHISRWETECREWLKLNGLDVFPTHMTTNIVTMSPDKPDMGARTDGKITGAPIHKRLEDPDSGFDD